MRAIIQTRHGGGQVLELQEVPKPSPGENEVLIQIAAATVTRGDVILRSMPGWMALPMRLFFGMGGKRIPGHELAGVVEAAGQGVSRFKEGEPVFGTTTGLRVGSYAEYVCLPEEWRGGVLAAKPPGIRFGEAAALPVGGMTALQILRKADPQAGQAVLIYGASGSVGTYAVQLAHSYGALVTGVCSSRNVELVSSLGASHVIDYTREDFTLSSQRYDVIFDAVGKLSESQVRRVLKEDGRYVSVKTMTKEQNSDLLELKELVVAGQVRPVIDRRYPLEQAAEAHRYVETGRKRGNVVLVVRPEAER